MKIKLIAVGTRMPDWVVTGFKDYQQRLPADYAIELIEISAAKRTKTADLPRIMQREGEQMLAAIPAGDYVIALTERGQLWDTVQLAQKLTMWRDQGRPISLLIGGPEGLAPACLARANLQWSLSPLTFPHPLVRILLAEQIYRAYSIIQHHPYHRA